MGCHLCPRTTDDARNVKIELEFWNRIRNLRRSAGTAGAKESLECGNMSGHWHKVNFHQEQITIPNNISKMLQLQAPPFKVCSSGSPRCNGRPRSTRISSQWNHSGEKLWWMWFDLRKMGFNPVQPNAPISMCSFNVFQWLPSSWHWAIPQSTISALTWRAPN